VDFSDSLIKKPSIPLSQLKKLLNTNQYDISAVALEGADHFGWGGEEIVMCLKRLKLEHFCKSEVHWDADIDPSLKDVKIDFYRANQLLNGVNIFTKFYFDPTSQKLKIQSFKER